MMMTSDAECSTLHIIGLPAGTTRHEVYLLLCTFQGFEHANLMYDKSGKGRGRPPVVFAKFDTTENASYAKSVLSTLPFEWGSSTLMSVAFAAQPSRAIKTDRSVDSNEDFQSSAASQRHGRGGFGGMAGQRADFLAGRQAGSADAFNLRGAASATLFMQSINAVPLTEEGIQTLTTNYPGVLKVTTRGCSAWIKFRSPEDASGALNLDGYEGEVISGARIKVQLARSDSYN